MPTIKIRVALVDDHPVLLEGLKVLLQHNMDFEVAGCYTSGESLLTALAGEPPDIILLDIALPDTSGILLCQTIKQTAPDTRVLIFSNHSERSMIMQAIQSGASGYLLKNASLAELSECIYEALEGKIAFSREVREIISRPTRNELAGVPQLTRREKQILKLVAEGRTSAAIAADLSLSVLTVETHRRNLMQKFAVKNTAELIRTGMLQGFI